MNRTSAWLLLWAPRLLGIAVCLFIAMFALDAFSEGQPLGAALGGFAVHLVPSLILAAIVAVAWRREWVGAVVFLLLAVAYALSVQRWDWILVISGPLALVGLLFLWSWRYHDTLHSLA